MSVIETIKERKSVRSYTGEPLSAELVGDIKKYISELKPPFGATARITFVSAQTGNEPVKLGTYGVISGATDFLVLITGNGIMSEVGAGYMFEQLVLHCTALGLGTCWLGGTVNRKDFLEQIDLQEGEKLAIISPVGYKRKKKTLLESIMRAGAGSNGRKPFGTLFFYETPETPLTEADAGKYNVPLEMVRLAPSANNKQPWRVILKEGNFHFYHLAGKFSANDLGIGLCHFEESCRELGLAGEFNVISDAPSFDGVAYVMSWTPE